MKSVESNRILIVEPDDAIRRELLRLLSQFRDVAPEVIEVKSAPEALQAYQASPERQAQIAILSMEILGERGDEWLVEARGSNPLLPLPIVVTCSAEDDDRIDAAITAGANDWLLLPGLSPRRLWRTLENALVSHRLVMQAAARMVALKPEHGRVDEQNAFLVEAGQFLSSSLDYESTLQQLAGAMVPRLADWCSVDILTEEREIVQVAVAHVDPAKIRWAKQWRAQHPPTLDDPRGLAHVLRTGTSEFYPEISQDLIDEAIRNAESEEARLVLQTIAFKSIMIVPLTTRSQILGAITLVWSDSDRRYDEADLAFVQDVARHAATAVDHARLYRESQLRTEELRLLNETLEQQVEERTQELRRSNQELDQFAYIASHDLKAPLRAIDHLSSWLLEDSGHLLPERSLEHLQKMRNRIQRMEGLLDDLLTYSRAGRFRGEAKLVDVNELVARVIDTVVPSESFEIHVEGTLPTLRTYPVPLETVLRNLVNNAIKHHDKPEGSIRIWATDVDDMVEFAVSDNGPGIDEPFHERIFQMFQTLRPRDQVEGSGIGLSVVEKIVSSVGGKVKLESSLGNGATFRFTWPRHFDE